MAISTPLAILLTLALAHTVLCQPKEEEDTLCEEDNCYDGVYEKIHAMKESEKREKKRARSACTVVASSRQW